jgi:hypothetical protein
MGSAPEIATVEMPIRTIAPPGTGLRIDPTIVAAKMARSRHDWTVIPLGTGVKAIAKPTKRTIAHLVNLLKTCVDR